jgi:hypothetical protein
MLIVAGVVPLKVGVRYVPPSRGHATQDDEEAHASAATIARRICDRSAAGIDRS